MAHLTAKQPFGTIDINTETGLIFVQEDWHYQWISLDPAHSSWTLSEKRAFHRAVDLQI